MKLYLIIIAVAMTVIAAVNIALETAAWYYVILAVVWCTVLQIVLDVIIATAIKMTPDRWYGVDNSLFHVFDIEKKLYKKLKVRLWKDKVLELGGIGGFSKKTLKEPSSPEYIEKFIIECNKGVVTHRLIYPIGFLAMLTVSGKSKLTIAIPVAIVNVFLNALPTMVLRYNTPKLKALLERLKRKRSEKEQIEATV